MATNNINVDSWWGHHTLVIDDQGFGVIDSEAEIVFTRGQCHALALALHKLTGWPIKGASYYRCSSWESPSHCLVYWREWRVYVDIEGVKKHPWIGRTKLVVSHRYLSPKRAKSGLGKYKKPNLRAAMPFARTILKQIAEKYGVVV